MFQFTTLPPLALYVHFPWCVRKCPYCDFNSHALREDLPEAAYLDALIADLEQQLPQVWGRGLRTVFMGGGTPSLISPAGIDRLLSAVRALLPLPPGAEITLEANPGTIEQGRFAEFRAAGVNRLSIGVQSFDDDRLAALGRIHDGREAVRAAETAQAAGFDSINLDLMYGLPGQDAAGALADLDTAIELGPRHISHYQLTLEPNTAFHHAPPALPDEEAIWDMQQRCQARLDEAGYAHYEVSAYARDGYRSRHNLNYWTFGDYLGIGAGAHGKISDARAQCIRRTARVRHPREYLAAAGTPAAVSDTRELSRADAGFEFMLNALRLVEGFPSALFAERSGLPIRTIEAPLRRAEERGWIEWTLARIRPTAEGQRYLNDLLELFLPPDD